MKISFDGSKLCPIDMVFLLSYCEILLINIAINTTKIFIISGIAKPFKTSTAYAGQNGELEIARQKPCLQKKRTILFPCWSRKLAWRMIKTSWQVWSTLTVSRSSWNCFLWVRQHASKYLGNLPWFFALGYIALLASLSMW